MQILSSEQIRQWDLFTMQHEPIASIDLMERAASKCLEWLEKNNYLQHAFIIYCGKGNNGGDGLALARMLWTKQCKVSIYILEFGHKGTEDFQTNLARLHQTDVEIFFIQSEDHLHPIPKNTITIDALFGYGLNRPLEPFASRLIEHINQAGTPVISIDIPSGMFANTSSLGGVIIKAAHTLTFQCYKLAFFIPENAPYFGEVHILDIGLHPAFLETIKPEMQLIEAELAKEIYRPRKSFSHKGTYGHALLVAGSFGKMGAAVLSAKACLRAGAGLLSCLIPGCGYEILQTSLPEAMVFTDPDKQWITSIGIDLTKYTAIGIGPGLGTQPITGEALQQLSAFNKPVVIDADGLNLVAANKTIFRNIPPFSILTPHPKEFERLFGPSENDFKRLELAQEKAKEHQLIIILKGHNTFVAMPGGKKYFNTTGNPGMATGGTGDVLTGMITGLLAQGYTPQEASLLGVYLHGLAGDFAACMQSQESMIASDLIDCLGEAFRAVGSRES